MRTKIKHLAIVITLGCLLCSVGNSDSASGSTVFRLDGNVEKALVFLERLQDSQPSGLVPIRQGQSFTTTYSNAMATIAFIAEGRLDRARKILDVFASRSDSCPQCACPGGFQQFRDPATANPLPDANRNDFWIGDNAWLLVALKYYRQVTADARYDALIQRLKDWFVCLENLTPESGIYSGFRKNGDLMNFKHPEGSIDVYGALKGLGADAVRNSVKEWLDQNVWVPEGNCFRIGPANQANLPTDNMSWGYLALGTGYECILSHAEALTARTQDRYLIEGFDRVVEDRVRGEVVNRDEAYWFSDKHSGNPSIEVSLAREQHGQGHDFMVTYSWNSNDAWLRVFRDRDIDLMVTNQFRYFFWLKGDGSGNQFEVKLQNKTAETFFYAFPMDFSEWRRIEIRSDQFRDFGGPHAVRLNRVGLIEFAINNSTRTPVTNRQVRIGRIWYSDAGAGTLFSADGFDAFESEGNWLFVEGTAQMATAYGVAGQMEKWQHYMSELTTLFQPTMNGGGLPSFLTGGINRPVPESVASSWFIVALRRLNPFDPVRTAR
jgi:hypothetical protein